MGRWTGSWLSGAAAAQTSPTQRWPGERLGLPQQGPGSVASVGRRLWGYLLDTVMSILVAGLFARTPTPGLWSLAVFVVEYVVLGALTGQSAGMRLAGIRIARVGVDAPLDLVRSVVRTALLVLLVPALIWDRDRRGMHDRATGTVVVDA